MRKQFFIYAVCVMFLFVIPSCQKPQYLSDTQESEPQTDVQNIEADPNSSFKDVPRPDRILNLSFLSDYTSSDGIVCSYKGIVYYTSVLGDILRYIDPVTGFAEILCKDPLCRHSGDNTFCLANPQYFFVLNIASDGNKLYVSAAKDKSMWSNGKWKEQKYGVYEIDAENGNFKTLTEWTAIGGRYIPAISLDGEYIYYSRRINAEYDYNELFRINKSGGQPEQLSSVKHSFNHFEIYRDKVYYTSPDDILHKSDFSMQNPEDIAQDAVFFTLHNDWIYTATHVPEKSKIGNYKREDDSITFKHDIYRINIKTPSERFYVCTTSSASGLPVFDGNKYYYMPYEPVNTLKHGEYDIINPNNGKIIAAEISTDEIIKVYQNDFYLGFDLMYAGNEILIVEAGESEGGELLYYTCLLNGDNINYYYFYEKNKINSSSFYWN